MKTAFKEKNKALGEDLTQVPLDLGEGLTPSYPRTPEMAEWIGGPADVLERPLEEYVPTEDMPHYTPKAIDINNVIDIYRGFYPNASEESVELIRQAYTFAAIHHSGETRLSGEPYLTHPLAVAHILANLKLDALSIAAGLLHDIVENTKITTEDIRINFGSEFGPTLAIIVDGVTKIGKTHFISKEQRRAANLSKMVLASMKDLRVLLVKLADRLHNMRTLAFMRQEKREEISQETLDYFAPFATRLGIHKIKAELEDLALFNLHPKDYTDITKNLSQSRESREQYVEVVKGILCRRLEEFNIEAEVDGRNKHIYSIWRKMKHQNIPFEQIYDLFAFRIIVNSIEDCYKVLGIVHTFFTPLPGRFKDYISLPKPNGYRSLHTAVVGPDNVHIEIQIRTIEMHSSSEDGVAAHWRYKVGGQISPEEQALIFKLRETLSQALSDNERKNPDEYLDDLKEFLDNKELIHVFTPKGDLVKLPVGSTPIDFAYQIHTDVGNHCSGAFVDGSIVNLEHKLENGVTVKIVTSKLAKPTRDWLNKVASPKAKSKIKQALLEQEPPVPPPPAAPGPLPKPAARTTERKQRATLTPSILVKGIDDIVVRFGKCCNPIPGEPITGFLTKTKGVTVHSKDCQSILGLPKERLTEVAWDMDTAEEFNTNVRIRIYHTGNQHSLPQIIHAISLTKSTILDFHADHEDNRIVDVCLAISDYDQYLSLTDSLNHLKGLVTATERIFPGKPRGEGTDL